MQQLLLLCIVKSLLMLVKLLPSKRLACSQGTMCVQPLHCVRPQKQEALLPCLQLLTTLLAAGLALLPLT